MHAMSLAFFLFFLYQLLLGYAECMGEQLKLMEITSYLIAPLLKYSTYMPLKLRDCMDIYRGLMKEFFFFVVEGKLDAFD